MENEYTIKVSTDLTLDKTNWTTIDTATNVDDKIDARYVWMDVTGVGHTANYGHGIIEFEIFMAKQ